ncbi:hypothetical protein F5148DRAFT_1283877 [Russula earlei]|uniref:Uncharacterized protein n=1 Tax=Russula earlei TaxID=71964 RepID=A0ACC0UB64_9AGAM|nr:hypothetical protein F5148DRAFT_1283877 [Russula earlei]
MALATAQDELTNEMWSDYLEDVKDYDTSMTGEWKEDADGVLVFIEKTAIFSATVAAFVIESYKMLSPDSGDQTVFLLGQLSLQLSGFANGTVVQPQPYTSSRPSISIICVNVVWLLSLVFSTASALFATLTQQWARRYLQLPRFPSLQSERARVRSYLFLGTRKYAMHHAVETAPTLLHFSVFLFHIGLVIFFFTIYTNVAIFLLVSVGMFGMAYFALTILPCLSHNCPYRTPLSSITWYLWHAVALVAGFCFRWTVKQLHTLVVPISIGDVGSLRQRKLTEWLDFWQDFLDRHGKHVKDGFRQTIIQRALAAPAAVDVQALSWLFQLPALAEKSKVQKFVASASGETIVRLFCNPSRRGRIPLRDHLSALLRSCEPGTSGGLEEDVRKRRLTACLDAIHHVVKATNVPYRDGASPSASVLDDLRSEFTNIGLMRTLWVDGDPSVRIAARSTCALLAKHVLHEHRSQMEGSVLAWLSDVLEKPSYEIYNQLVMNNVSAVDDMNVDSFAYGVLSSQTDDLPIMQAISFTETLALLIKPAREASLSEDTFRGQLSLLIRRIEQDDHPHRGNVLEKLRRMFHEFLSSTGQ